MTGFKQELEVETMEELRLLAHTQARPWLSSLYSPGLLMGNPQYLALLHQLTFDSLHACLQVSQSALISKVTLG